MVPVAAPQPSILLFLSLACNGNWNKPDCRLTRLKSRRNGISSKRDASTSCQPITAPQTYLRANALLHISPSCRLQQPTCWNEKGTSNTAGLPTRCRGRQNAGRISGEMNVKVRIYGDDVIMEKKGQWRSLENVKGVIFFLIPFKSFIVSRPMSCKNSFKDTPGAPSKQTLSR